MILGQNGSSPGVQEHTRSGKWGGMDPPSGCAGEDSPQAVEEAQGGAWGLRDHLGAFSGEGELPHLP